MKQVKVIAVFLCILLMLASCTASFVSEPPQMPKAFKTSVKANYDSLQLTLTAEFTSYNDLRLVFLTPEQFEISVSGTDYTIKVGSSSNVISEQKLPDRGFPYLFVKSMRNCIFGNNGEPSRNGDSFIYTADTDGMKTTLFVNGETGVPEKITIDEIGFEAVFTEFTPL